MQLRAEKDGVQYVYDENFWTGKKQLSVNGMQLEKTDRRTFAWQDDAGIRHTLKIKGSFLSGISLVYENGSELELFKNKWYEWLLIFLPFVGIVFGIFCGAVGGGLSAACAFMGGFSNALLLRSEKLPLAVRVLLCILVAVIVNLAWFFVWLLIAQAILGVL